MKKDLDPFVESDMYQSAEPEMQDPSVPMNNVPVYDNPFSFDTNKPENQFFNENAESYLGKPYQDTPRLAGVKRDLENTKFMEMKAEADAIAAGMPSTAPSTKDYDYTAGLADGYNFNKTDGVPLIPNKYMKPERKTAAGYDLATGKKQLNSFEDPYGLVQEGAEKLQQGGMNADGSQPLDAAEGLASIALGAMEEGKTKDDYIAQLPDDYDPEIIDTAWEAAARVEVNNMAKSGELDEFAKAIPDAKLPEIQEPFDEEDLLNSEPWMNDARAIQAYIEEATGGANLIQGATDEDVFEWTVNQMSQLTSPTYGGINIGLWAFAPDEVKQSIYRVYSTYQQSNTSLAQVGRSIGYNIIDPTAWASVGLGSAAMKLAGATTIGKILGFTGITAAEGAAYTTLDEFYAQTIPVQAGQQDGYDTDRLKMSAAVGAAAGPAIGWAVKGATTDVAIDYYKKLGKRAAANLKEPSMRQGGYRSQMGAVGDVENIDKARIEKAKQGEIVEPPLEIISGKKGINKFSAETRRGRSVEELKVIIPNEDRVVGKDLDIDGPIKHNDGRQYKDRDLDAVENKVELSQQDFDDIYQKSLDESPKAASLIAKELEMTPKDAEFWNKALALPDRARFWYEISSEGMRSLIPFLSSKELSQFFQIVGATSPQADPNVNMRRALSLLGYEVAGLPADTAIAKKAGDMGGAVRKAFSGVDFETNKIHNFSGTFEFLMGLIKEAPLSTNDRQVASSFGISETDLFGSQALYEPISRFYMNLRDELNARLPEGAEPYQTWQLQAMGWVEERIRKGQLEGDDYLMAMEKIQKTMKNAGIMADDGLFTPEVLTNPRFQELIDPTTPKFLDSKFTTIETFSERSPETAKAIDMMGDIKKYPVQLNKFNAIPRRTMNKIANRVNEYDWIPDENGKLVKKKINTTLSIASRLYGAITGDKTDLTRIDFGMGTFGGDANENMRIPLPADMTDSQVNQYLAVLGKGLNQWGSPASKYSPARKGAEPTEGATRTYSVFLDIDAGKDLDLAEISKVLGHDLSVKYVPNGTVLDVIPLDGEGSPKKVDLQQLDDLVGLYFTNGKTQIKAVDFTSNYVDISQTDELISKIPEDIELETLQKLREVLPNATENQIKRIRQGSRAKDLQKFYVGNRRKLEGIVGGADERISSLNKLQPELDKILAEQEAEVKQITDAVIARKAKDEARAAAKQAKLDAKAAKDLEKKK